MGSYGEKYFVHGRASNIIVTLIVNFNFFNITNFTPSKVYENAENLQKFYHNNDLASTFAN